MTSKPPALRPGDLVGVCAPSGVVEAEPLARGVAALEALGLRVRVPDGLAGARDLFMAGSVARRLDELYALYDDPDVTAIVCARGGAGVLQLLPHLDVRRLLARPKILVGYSDVTPLHVRLNQHGQVTFHGPMVARDFAEGLAERDSFRAAVMGEGAPLTLAGEPLAALRAGVGEGVLLGGCLSLLAALCGTPWALCPSADTLLFLEDWDEPPYRIERLLWQLRRAGLFERVRGVVFGELRGCFPGVDVPYRLEDVLQRALEGLDVPVAVGLPSGHTTRPNVTLPFGVRARLECGAGGTRFEVLEPAVE